MVREDESFAAEPDVASRGTGPSAQQARRDEVHDQPRPQQLGQTTEDIREAVRVQDTESTWMVYRKEWLVVHTQQFDPDEDPDGHHAAEACEAFYKLKYEGRVEEEDWHVHLPRPGICQLMLRTWNVKAEWKTRLLAEDYVETAYANDENVRIVGRATRDEQDLKDYSVKKLLTALGQKRAQAKPQSPAQP